ncbi:MAG: DEAD/DEAH box helicase family protein [Deltaproteobacteria bacterium]|nr:DEAD/DEAH box helicase family protein [Deltaproteobacteria bacterium]
MGTAYHSQYWAHALSLRGSGGNIESLSRSIANARVDLNPHQIDAALFALRSPLSNGAIFADEVGLGKTIEAGIVLAQRWAERRRRILIIVPAMLRKQWQQELEQKFYLPCVILDTKVFNRLVKDGFPNPFDQENRLVICSYHFASAKSAEISRVPWDVAVIDEAHRLRNVYRSRNKTDPLARKSMSHKIADALERVSKLLLTATPLQNSLMELYGLASVIDEHVFGDSASFREQFVRISDNTLRNEELKQRLGPICIRTLRKQVMEYVPFTRRVPITQEFLPSDAEHELYERVSSYLQRESLFALPASQRQLITLILRKLLASSTFAIARTLHRLVRRLENIQEQVELLDDEDLEGIDELEDEWQEDGADDLRSLRDIDSAMLKDELSELRRYADLADSIQNNAKGGALIPALQTAFEHAQKLGAARKAVIFTESRRTQEYLFDLLSANGYEGQLVTINGSNSDALSRDIYLQWVARHEGQDVVTGSKPVDIKGALVEHFRDNATILIATEAAAEGVNLQFASLVVNYDLPWNPQRIEQRIGRCHRYGQKYDVVVVNFLNRRNKADQRVFQLLSEKFRLFDGVFGASDEVLGALESGVDIERRIAQVYQECRTSQEIQSAFDTLQAELDTQIQARLTETRQSLLEHFDEDVRSRLRVSQTVETLSQRERWLFDLTRAELNGHAEFDPALPRFRYSGTDARKGWYNLDWKQAEAWSEHFYRQDHPLALQIIERAISRDLPPAEVTLNYSGYESRISILEPLVGQSGWLELSKLTVEALNIDEFLIFAAQTDTGQVLDEEICGKLLLLPGQVGDPSSEAPDLSGLCQAEVQAKLDSIDKRNGEFFDGEVLKLDRWSEDLKQGLEREIKEIDKQIREARKTAALAQSLQDKLAAQKVIKALEKTRNTKRRELFDAQDAIDAQREELIENIEKQLKQRRSVLVLFCIRWALV